MAPAHCRATNEPVKTLKLDVLTYSVTVINGIWIYYTSTHCLLLCILKARVLAYFHVQNINSRVKKCWTLLHTLFQ